MFSIIALLLLIVILLWLTYPALYLFVRTPLGYNEGWNALISARAMSDVPLYPADRTLHTNNYPPLSFYIVGTLGHLVGDNIYAGRIVSFASTLAIAAEVAAIVRLLGGCWRFAGFAGLVFLGGLIGLGSIYIGYNDPQLLGHAVMLGGLLVLMRRRTDAHVIAAAVLMVSAGLIKHSMIALPLAVTAWLLMTDRRALAVWLLAAAAALAAALLVLWLLYGAPLVDNMLSARSFDLHRTLRVTKQALAPMQIFVLGSLLLVAACPGAPSSRFVAAYCLCSLAVGVLFVGGAGTGTNMFFDLLIANAIGAGLLLQQATRVASSWRPGATRAFVAIAYLLAIGVSLPSAPLRLLLDSPIHKQQTDTGADLAFLESIDGRVMCETLALCYWSAKGLEVDTFNARQGFLVAGHDEQVLLDLLAHGDFAAVQVTRADPERDDERFSPTFMQHLLQHYAVARSSRNGVILVYRGE